ncbi:hypothetical protein JCM9279_006368 [Rhodotorula babjevae]
MPPQSSPHSPPAALPTCASTSSSLHTILLSPPRPSQSAPAASTFAFSSLAGVWSNLKAAASVEIAGFVRGFTGGGAARAGDEGSRGHGTRVGDKRVRAGEGSQTGRGRDGERRGKRRRVAEARGDDLLFDGVPPLMPPISQSSALPSSSSYDSLSSSPRQHRNPSSSPASSRHPRRSYADTSYADELVRAVTTDEGLSSSLAPRASTESSRRSGDGSGLRSLSGRRRVDPAGAQVSAHGASAASSTSALAAHGPHRHERSHAQPSLHRRAQVDTPRAQPATLSASTSLPSLASSSSTASPHTPRERTARQGPQTSTTHFTEASDQCERAWRTEKEQERRQIEELREEVQRLKGELSAQKQPAFTHIPRISAPPPPPPPPGPRPPPVGRPNPILTDARAHLRATPERPSRRHSAIPGVGAVPRIDMSASELGAQRDKLRKVGLPTSRTQDDLRRSAAAASPTSGELSEVLSRALQRKLARLGDTRSPAAPRTASGSGLRLSTAPDWAPLALSASRSSGGGSTLSASQSVPGGLTALARSRSRSPLRPARRLGLSYDQDASAPSPVPHAVAAAPAAAETIGLDHAPAQDEVRASRPRPRPDEPTSAGMSPSLSSASLPSAPPEPAAPASARSAAPASGSSGSPRDKLPGLELGRSRPVTPARRRSRAERERASEEKARVLVEGEGEDEQMLEAEAGDGVVRVDFGSDSEGECDGMEELVGCGERRADPARVFGRA